MRAELASGASSASGGSHTAELAIGGGKKAVIAYRAVARDGILEEDALSKDGGLWHDLVASSDIIVRCFEHSKLIEARPGSPFKPFPPWASVHEYPRHSRIDIIRRSLPRRMCAASLAASQCAGQRQLLRPPMRRDGAPRRWVPTQRGSNPPTSHSLLPTVAVL